MVFAIGPIAFAENYAAFAPCQAKRSIVRAREDYEEALELYPSIFPYGESGLNIQLNEARIEKLEERLAELDEGRQ